MARRISLPSSDELFGDRGPYAPTSAEPKRRKAAERRPEQRRRPDQQRRQEDARPARRNAAPRRPRVVTRIDRVEKRLRDLPIDSLLELRDGLEALLLGGEVSEAEVERVLAAAGG